MIELQIRPPPARLLLTVGAVLLVALMGVLDFVTGPEFGFSLFYLLPVVATAWGVARAPGVLVAIAASLAWLFADVPWRGEEGLPAALWNGVSRLAIFLTVALLVARVRADQRKLAELVENQTRLARTDALTELPNARAFMEHLRAEVARSRRHNIPICLAFVDVDNFKDVNDRYGHAAGDEVLRRVGSLLDSTTREEDMAARIGGDEFAVLFWAVDADSAKAVGERITEAVGGMRQQFPKSGIGASIGMVHCSHAPPDAAELLQSADRAMYEAKNAGKHRVHVVTETRRSAIPTRRGESSHVQRPA